MVRRDPKTIKEAVEMALTWLASRPGGGAMPGDDDGFKVASRFGLVQWVAGTLVERNRNQHLLVADFYRRSERKAVRGTVPTDEIADFVLGEVRKRMRGDGGTVEQ